MIKKAVLYSALSIAYAIGMSFRIVSNGFLSIAENIVIKLEEKKPTED